MAMTFSQPQKRFESDLSLMLLFRDNVQHHLQAGRPRPGYPLIHALADVALDGGVLRLPASELWMEISRALEALEAVELKDLAVSLRTRALLTNASVMPAVRGTVPIALSDWRVPIPLDGARTLGELFAGFRRNLAELTEHGRRASDIEVTL